MTKYGTHNFSVQWNLVYANLDLRKERYIQTALAFSKNCNIPKYGRGNVKFETFNEIFEGEKYI